MNINFSTFSTPQTMAFKGKSAKTADSFDIVKNSFPLKQEFSEVEKEFNDVLVKYNNVSQNARSQKEMLKIYYSAQDKYDYKELMKEKNKLSRQLKKIASKAGTDNISMEMDIIAKKTYNRYTPKIYNAKNLSQLEEDQKLINESTIFVNVKATLLKIISECRKYLK